VSRLGLLVSARPTLLLETARTASLRSTTPETHPFRAPITVDAQMQPFTARANQRRGVTPVGWRPRHSPDK
jgi:hypothetical protein